MIGGKGKQAEAQRLAVRMSQDISRVEEVNTRLQESIALIGGSKKYRPIIFDRLVVATAAELQAFVTGIETMIEHLVKFKIGSLPAGKSSHKGLLISAKNGKIIDETQHSFLRELSSLRHFVRHAYGVQPDFDIVVNGAKKTIEQWPDIRAALVKQQESLARQDEVMGSSVKQHLQKRTTARQKPSIDQPSDGFGALKSKRPYVSIKAETAAMEKAGAVEVIARRKRK